MKKVISIVLIVCLALTLISCSLPFVGKKDTSISDIENSDDYTTRARRTTEESDDDARSDGTRRTTSNSRSNPANVNEKIVYDSMRDEYDAFKLEITLIEVLRGGAALKKIFDADIYNDIPPEGKEYLLAKFSISALQSKNDSAIDVGYLFDVVKANGNKYDDTFAYVTNFEMLNTMYQDSEQEGYVCFVVDKEDKDTLILFPLYAQNPVWFSGKQSVGDEYDDYNPFGDPNKPGSRNNPAGLNETVNYNGIAYYRSVYEFNIDITITELIRGQRALDTAMLASKYNDHPPSGKEYLFAKVKIEAIASKDNNIIDISNYDFQLVNPNGVAYSNAYLSGLDDKELSSMSPGTNQEGYLYFEVDENDPNPLIVAFDFSDIPLWFSAAKSDRTPLTDANSIDREQSSQSTQSTQSSQSSQSSNSTTSNNKRNPYVEAWALGCSAVMATFNGYEPYEYGMFEKNDENAVKAMLILSTSWSCSNREELISTILRMTDNGHNSSFAEAYKTIGSLNDSDYKALLKQTTDDNQKIMIELTKTLGDKWGDKQIKAWDWFRMIHLAGWGYIAGYLDLEESYEYMLPSISNLKATFSSWDEACENWLDGFAWWADIDISEKNTAYSLRSSIYEVFRSSTVLFDPTVWD